MPTFQMRRGAVSGLPSLSAGQPGFTTDQFRLYVGSSGGNRLVGLLNKIDGTTAPTPNDDAGDHFSVGSMWIDTTNDKAYQCVDSTVGAAVWQQYSGTGAPAVSATSRVLGRKTSGAGASEELTLSEVLDFIGSAAQGDILYRGASTWQRLAATASATRHILTSASSGAPAWTLAMLEANMPGDYSGQIKGQASTTASESTASTTAVDLTTTQHVTFSLSATRNVLVLMFAVSSTNSAGAVNRLICDVNGTDTIYAHTMPAASANYMLAAAHLEPSMAAGTHTIKMQYSVSAGTGSFFNRRCIVIAI